MPNFEGYQPPPKEVKKAEKMMSEEQESLSLLREKEYKTEKAKEIMKENFLGIEAAKSTFGVELKVEVVPVIPFSDQELQEANERGEQLILRIDKAQDAQPLTMKKMNEVLAGRLENEGKGQILYDLDLNLKKAELEYKNESFYTNQAPELSWALVSRNVIPNSIDKYYSEQTEVLAKHLDMVFGTEKPKEVQDAIDEFTALKAEYPDMKKSLETSWNKEEHTKINNLLTGLKINQMFRRSPNEALYDLMVNFESNNERLLKKTYDYTNVVSDSTGYAVRVGLFDEKGVRVEDRDPAYSHFQIGVTFSRRA